MSTCINCSVGNVLQSECSKKKYSTQKKDVINVESLNEEERQSQPIVPKTLKIPSRPLNFVLIQY